MDYTEVTAVIQFIPDAFLKEEGRELTKDSVVPKEPISVVLSSYNNVNGWNLIFAENNLSIAYADGLGFGTRETWRDGERRAFNVIMIK